MKEKNKNLNYILKNVVKDGMEDDFKDNLYIISSEKKFNVNTKDFDYIENIRKVDMEELDYAMINNLIEKHIPHYNDKTLPRLDMKLLKYKGII